MVFTANGNIASITNQNVTSPGTSNPLFSNTYTYDGLNRLTTATSSSSGGNTQLFATEEFAFDDLGRMNTRSIGGTSHTYLYSDTNHIDAPTSYISNTYQYDAAGNQITGTVKTIAQHRAFDAENRLLSVVTGTNTISFVYDANGKRVIQSTQSNSILIGGGSPKRTLYVGNLYEEELVGTYHPYIVYYMLGTKMVALRRGNYGADNGQYRIVIDHLQGTSLIVDTSSPPTVKHRQYYKPYGEVAFESPSGGSLTTVGYTGQRLDGDTGLMYYGARYYDAGTIVFLSTDPTIKDPTNPMDYARYMYVRGNPLRYIDTSGYGADDYYLWFHGCVGLGGCDNSPLSDFGQYTELLKGLFTDNNWGNQHRDQNGHPETWEHWSSGHLLHQKVSPGLMTVYFDATKQVADLIASVPAGATGNINLLGTSAGGAAIWGYFAAAKAGNYTIDSRIASAVTIDAPVGDIQNKPDGAWLASHTRITAVTPPFRGTALTEDLDGTVVAADPIPGVENNDNPTYPGLADDASSWDKHNWTGQNVSTQTRSFLLRVWR
jgi:RHS repeat-associated protein